MHSDGVGGGIILRRDTAGKICTMMVDAPDDTMVDDIFDTSMTGHGCTE